MSTNATTIDITSSASTSSSSSSTTSTTTSSSRSRSNSGTISLPPPPQPSLRTSGTIIAPSVTSSDKSADKPAEKSKLSLEEMMERMLTFTQKSESKIEELSENLSSLTMTVVQIEREKAQAVELAREKELENIKLRTKETKATQEEKAMKAKKDAEEQNLERIRRFQEYEKYLEMQRRSIQTNPDRDEDNPPHKSSERSGKIMFSTSTVKPVMDFDRNVYSNVTPPKGIKRIQQVQQEEEDDEFNVSEMEDRSRYIRRPMEGVNTEENLDDMRRKEIANITSRNTTQTPSARSRMLQGPPTRRSKFTLEEEEDDDQEVKTSPQGYKIETTNGGQQPIVINLPPSLFTGPQTQLT
jgi:hypothetical protein